MTYVDMLLNITLPRCQGEQWEGCYDSGGESTVGLIVGLVVGVIVGIPALWCLYECYRGSEGTVSIDAAYHGAKPPTTFIFRPPNLQTSGARAVRAAYSKAAASHV